MNRRTVSDFEDAYDAASILDESVPPDDLVHAAQCADIVCSSDLRRALASAHRVAPGREVMISPLLREIRMEPPWWLPIPLPIAAWDRVSHVQWSYRLRSGRTHPFVQRADAAVDWLAQQIHDASTALIVTHAGFRRLLAAALLQRGWRGAQRAYGYEHWSTWEFERRDGA